MLLADNDPQSSVTQGRWGPPGALPVDPAVTIAAVHAAAAFPGRVIHRSGILGVEPIPGSVHATRHNVAVPHEAEGEAQPCLRSFSEDTRRAPFDGRGA